jgi:hypothetical protein
VSQILDVPFGGLQGLVHPNRTPFEQAITATDCFLDDNTVFGRSGYRSLMAAFVAASGNAQFIGRFQPSLGVPARTVIVISGNVWLVTDASSETASDATAAQIGTATFGSTENISGAQLGTNFYLATDAAIPKWVRITSAFSLAVLQQLPVPVLPAFTLSTLTFTQFTLPPANWTFALGLSGSAAGVSPWTQLTGTVSGTGTYDLTVAGSIPAYNWANTAWLLVACSPETISGGGGQFKISLGNAANSFVDVQTIVDPPNTNGSPFCVYLYLAGLDQTILKAVTQIRFTQIGPTTDPFCVLGYMPINTAPAPGTVPYYVTYYNSVTQSESALSPVTNVVYNNNGLKYPTYPAARWNYNNFIGAGTASTNPDSLNVSACFNKGAGLAFPTATSFASVYTFSGTIPAGAQYTNADTVRLYRGTPNGISLVGSSVYSSDGTAANARRADASMWTTGTGTTTDLPTNVSYWQAAGTTWTITDNIGQSAAANAVYNPGGPGPQTSTMCSFAGRLVAGYGTRVYISSFTPVTAASNLIPQWPPIAVQDSDGWAFDIAPTPTEQILSIVSGDAVYICTNKRVLALRSLTPGTVPFEVLNRGVIGRQAALYAEQQLIWASYDGVYAAQNVSSTSEISQSIRIYVYLNSFVPDSTVAIGYQLRKLHVFKGKKRLRYDFVTSKWTGPDTLANSIFSVTSFPVSASSTFIITEQMWALTSDRFVTRFQPSCVFDNQIGTAVGVPPPPWVYSTGFAPAVKPGFISEVSLLASGVITAKIAKTLDGLEPSEGRTFVMNDQLSRTEVAVSGPTDLRGNKLRVEFGGVNTVTLYAAYVKREDIEARGG